MHLKCGTPGFHPWAGTIPWRRTWQHTPIFLPGESQRREEPSRRQSLGVAKSDTTEQLSTHTEYRELPLGLSDKESACQYRRYKRCGFDPWVGKILWRMKFQPTLAFLPGKYYTMDRGAWQATVYGVAKELLVPKRLMEYRGL